MTISIDLIKQLREETHAPLGDCKKVLEEAEGNIERAKELLRAKGIAKAEKKADRETHNGVVKAIAKDGVVVILKVLCETDFVAKNTIFLSVVDGLIDMVFSFHGTFGWENVPSSLLSQLQTALNEQVATIGEKLVLGFVQKISGTAYAYNHMGNTLSSVVFYEGGTEDIAKSVAMQVAAMNPQYLSFSDIPADLIAQKRELFLAELAGQNKPEDIKNKIVEGKIQKYFQDDVLLEQIYIKDQTKTVKNILNGMTITSFLRITL